VTKNIRIFDKVNMQLGIRKRTKKLRVCFPQGAGRCALLFFALVSAALYPLNLYDPLPSSPPLAALDTAYALPDPYQADEGRSTRIIVPLSWREVRVEVYAESGAFLVRLQGDEFEHGEYLWPWNGCDDEGRVLPPGVYFIRVLYKTGEAEERCVFPLRLYRNSNPY